MKVTKSGKSSEEGAIPFSQNNKETLVKVSFGLKFFKPHSLLGQPG